MGFMEGLGGAFARSFEMGNERRAQMENDAFKMAYSDFIDRKNEYKAEEGKWKKATEAGNLLAQRYGAPPEAGLKAAEWLMAGYSESYVDDMFSKNKFSVTPQTDNEDRVQTLDTQMSDSGLSQPPTTPDPTAMPDNNQQGLLPNSVFGPGGLFPNAGESPTQRAQRKVQETLQIGQEEFDQVNSGFQQPSIPEMQMTPMNGAALDGYLQGGITKADLAAAKTELAQLKRNPDPKSRDRASELEAIIPDMEAALLTEVDPVVASEAMRAVNSTKDQRIQLGESRAAALDVAAAAKDITDVVEATNGKVLTLTSAGANLADNIITEGKAIFDFVTNGNPDAQVTEEQLVNGVQNYVRQQGASDEYGVYKANEIRFIFALAKAQGMSGNGMSNKDYDNLARSIFVGNRPDVYVRNMKGLVQKAFNSVDRQAQALGTLTEIRDIGAKYFPSVLESVKPMNELYGDDPIYQWAFEEYKGPSTTPDPVEDTGNDSEGTSDNTETPQPGYTYEFDGNTYTFKGGDPGDKNNWVLVK